MNTTANNCISNTDTGDKPSKREMTRAKVVEAAIDCIFEQGFHNAHTNRITERAGVSWGVLQYHFGDKEGLLQAVLDRVFENFSGTLIDTHFDEDSLSARLDKTIDVIWSLLQLREYRVGVAIMRNVRSEDSALDIQKKSEDWARVGVALWQRMVDGVPVAQQHSNTGRRLLFATLRGLADELNPSDKVDPDKLQPEFSALRDGLCFLLRRP